jgi:molybdenum cofactor cytidylyltransferase
VISAVVLAAGTSSRFGSTKQVEPVAGKPLAQHAIDAAAEASVNEVLVVIGHDAERVRSILALPRNARWVENPRYGEGIATSLGAGLRAVGRASEAAVVLMGDQPGITAAHVRSLMDAFLESRAPIVRLLFRNGPGPSILAREIWGEALALEGDVGARALVERHPHLVREVHESGAEAPPDVDTREDIALI